MGQTFQPISVVGSRVSNSGLGVKGCSQVAQITDVNKSNTSAIPLESDPDIKYLIKWFHLFYKFLEFVQRIGIEKKIG